MDVIRFNAQKVTVCARCKAPAPFLVGRSCIVARWIAHKSALKDAVCTAVALEIRLITDVCNELPLGWVLLSLAS